jgi:hypothetical protein
LDCNSIIYDAVHNIDFTKLVASDVDTIIRTVCNKIDEYIFQLKPDNIVYIAFDGVAPVAKLEQQRSRRYKSLYQNNISKSIFKDTKPDPWNTTAITPGTVFMSKLNETIRKNYNDTKKYNINSFILSPSDKYGEGEHKLMSYMRVHGSEGNNVIYGLDGDLFVLGILNQALFVPKAKIFFLREDTTCKQGRSTTELHSGEDALNKENPNTLIWHSLQALRAGLLREKSVGLLDEEWLKEYDRDLYLDTNKPSVTYEEFIGEELIHFSKYDCDRSIPNLMDGLKISLRKILYSAFKKNLTSEIKVAQFSGYVSEHSGYHHGEASLNMAIVGMAQNFVGSNNINLFVPSGQFGTRGQNGSDYASERYIFTYLQHLTRLIFRSEDDAILTYLEDDGLKVEPIFYVPIIPMILVNGSKGIGTGFSTDIMCYNPIDIM